MVAINLVRRFFLVMVLGIIFLATAQSALAIPVSELGGYAWSSNIGWISLNCKTGGVTGNDICGTANYKVTINADQTVSGYAWSSNVGWIRFGGLSGFPTGAGTSASNVNVTGTYPNLTFNGWARACAGTNNPIASEQKDCSSMTNNDNSGGWDGWISLRGTGYQVTTNTSGVASNSYIWGSEVVGWVDMFSYVTWLKPSATLTVASCQVTLGNSSCNASTTWNITNGSGPYAVTRTPGGLISSSVSGTNVLVSLALGSYTFAVSDGGVTLVTAPATASCAAGTVASGTMCVVTPPVITMTLSKPIARAGDTVVATWTITPSPLASGSCTLSGPGLSGTMLVGGSQTSAALKSKSRFGITCVGGYGTIEASDVVEIIPSAQEV